MLVQDPSLKTIIETALMTLGRPISIEEIRALFDEEVKPSKKDVSEIFEEIATSCEKKEGFELKRLSDGTYRYQVKPQVSPWVSKLLESKPSKFSKTLLETLAIIIYKQPITRSEIEAIRGVAVSTLTLKTLTDKEWVKIIAYKDLPGKPAVYGTTEKFLDYFNLNNLGQLPSLEELNILVNEEKQVRKLVELEASTEKVFSQLKLMNDAFDQEVAQAENTMESQEVLSTLAESESIIVIQNSNEDTQQV